MNMTPEEFIMAIKHGDAEPRLNIKSDAKTVDELLGMGIRKEPVTLKYLMKHLGHSIESGALYLNTDYSNGYTICKKCGSYYHLGKGFTKHLSNGCLHCEGESKHRVYYNNGGDGFRARYMSSMFDDGMQYCVDKLEKEKYKNLVSM